MFHLIRFLIAISCTVFTITAHADITCPAGQYLNSDTCVATDTGYYASGCTGTLPDGYTQLEYIQGTGTQWIDTDYRPTINTSMQFGINMTQQSVNAIIGSMTQYMFFMWTDEFYFDFSGTRLRGDEFIPNVYYDIEIGNLYIIKNGNLVLSAQAKTSVATQTIGIFPERAGTPTKGKIYYLRIYENGELVREYIPARRDNGGNVGMYETQTKKFFDNNGTGEFVAATQTGCTGQTICPAGHYCTDGILRGKCPTGKFSAPGATTCSTPDTGHYVAGGINGIGHTEQIICPIGHYCANGVRTRCPTGTYAPATGTTTCTTIDETYYGTQCTYAEHDGITQLEYIRGTGTQYINTEYIPTANTSFKLGVTVHEVSNRVPVGATWRMTLFNGTAVARVQWDYVGLGRKTESWFLRDIYYDFECGNNYVIQNNVLVISGTKQSTLITFGIPIYLFTNSPEHATANGTINASIYYFQIYENGELVHDLIPAHRNSDSTIGMYDTITRKFYSNAGTGTFTAGPSLPGCANTALCTAGSYCTRGIRTMCVPGMWSTAGVAVCDTCTNSPNNSFYTTAGWTNENCPWACNDGFGQTWDDKCNTLCGAGITRLRTGTGLSIPLFAARNTTPSINIGLNGNICYADLVPGRMSGTLHIQYDNKTYHTTP